MMTHVAAVDALPGFRRRIRITPTEGVVTAAVEDDYHCMVVTLHHDGNRVSRVDADMRRVPWTTCPGAQQHLVETFSGKPLSAFRDGSAKSQNCTHLFDMAQLAAEHALGSDELVYDILVSDPIDGQSQVELRRNGVPLLAWIEERFVLVSPPSLKGQRLDKLGRWIDAQPEAVREAARILRWANMIAHGRQRPLEQQSDATKMPPNCFTFQPHRAVEAVRVGKIFDFSNESRELLNDNDYS